jgi:tRNA G26 N,N-dimethylase Trm1
MFYPEPRHISSVVSDSRHKFIRPAKSWWGPIWRGLLVEETAKHYKAMGRAVWLYMYLIVHADRQTGTLFRQLPTISKDMGLKVRTIRQWLAVLRKHGYINTVSTGRALKITIEKWRPIGKSIKG